MKLKYPPPRSPDVSRIKLRRVRQACPGSGKEVIRLTPDATLRVASDLSEPPRGRGEVCGGEVLRLVLETDKKAT